MNVLLFGGSSGIGKAIYENLKTYCSSIIVIVRDKKKFNQLFEKNSNTKVYQYDLSDSDNLFSFLCELKIDTKLNSLIYSVGIESSDLKLLIGNDSERELALEQAAALEDSIEAVLLEVIKHKIEVCTNQVLIAKLEQLTSPPNSIEDDDLTALNLPKEIKVFAKKKVAEIAAHAKSHGIKATLIKEKIVKFNLSGLSEGDILNLLKLILKSKRIIKIIRKISGLKNIVLDNQIKCNTPKIEIT